jgi:hypothetical protein
MVTTTTTTTSTTTSSQIPASSSLSTTAAGLLAPGTERERERELHGIIQSVQGLAPTLLWSPPFRGVARYLKTLFDEDSGLGRKSVAIDHLVRGKTRKEASRMFFETLVRRLIFFAVLRRTSLPGQAPQLACCMCCFTPCMQVLTTKDYISVDQPNPFDFVSVKPGPKLLMSEF